MITFITTINHNIGDDLVREGQKFLFKKYFASNRLKFFYIHKHRPITSRRRLEFLNHLKKHKKIDQILPLRITGDKILKADLIVQSGAPVYWCHTDIKSHCCENEWFEPLIKRRFAENQKAKLLNISAGSCQKYLSSGDDFCIRCKNYSAELYDLCTVTTVRDKIAKNFLNIIQLDAPIIACSSLFSTEEYNIKREKGDYIVLNFMPLGGHYDFNQKINKLDWFKIFSDFYHSIKDQEKVVFCCFDKNEKYYALKIDPNVKVFYSKNFVDYLKFFAQAKFGIANRVHCVYLLASLGKPSFYIGNDTRSRMVDEIALKREYVKQVSLGSLIEEYHNLKSMTKIYPDMIEQIKTTALNTYLDHFSKARI